MEQHPVPQNVTTFQFRLIGDMTLKQFGYLAGGAILGYIFFKLPLPLFLNWPLAILFGLGGFGFAFVPIEERPMDVWVLSFFKSIYSPTQYTWAKTEAGAAPKPQPPPPIHQTAPGPVATPIKNDTAPQTRRGDLVQNLFTPGGHSAQQAPMKNPFDWLFDMLMPKPRASGSTAQTAALAPHPQTATAPAAATTQTSLPSTMPASLDYTPPPTVKPRAPSPDSHLQKQLDQLAQEKADMEAELARLRTQTAKPPPEVVMSPPPKPAPSPVQKGTYIATPASHQGPSVRVITPDRAVYAGIPRLTTFPNIITGIVKDGDQNLLPGVLVTVKDKEGVPVRALKTNRLGQFAASTQLANGTYFVEIEDPRLRYTFDRAQITLNGSIVPALEIFAKTQKDITRAKLEKELFGKPT